MFLTVTSAAVLAVVAWAEMPRTLLGASGNSSRSEFGDVYRVRLTLEGAPHALRRVEWIAPESGAWRFREGETTKIFTGEKYVVKYPFGAYVRTGSASFLRGLQKLPISDDAVREYAARMEAKAGMRATASRSGSAELHFSFGRRSVVAFVKKLKLTEGEASKLFSIPAGRVVTRARELRAGQATRLSLRPYWFGTNIAGRTAATVVEHEAKLPEGSEQAAGWSAEDAASLYIVFYEEPSAQGRSSAIPNEPAPEGELQVVSQPVASAAAKQDLAAFDGDMSDLRGSPWPRFSTKTENGEAAIVFIAPDSSDGLVERFAVATPTTLVNVSGKVPIGQIDALTRKLKPVTR
ncbi:MAG TPA: hypothetical protein VN960_04535 [Gaiellaceae bacterium]|nr:hypothetical protein [Gaiellaceae bacterium]